MKKVLAIMLAAAIGLSLSAQPKRLTVKEFLKLSPKDTASYIVSGVVSKIRSSSSGSFYLTDRTGTMLVYGLMDPKEPRASFSMLNIMKGDTLTVQGRFLLYAGQTKEMKDALLLSMADGPEHGKTFLERLDRQPSFQGKLNTFSAPREKREPSWWDTQSAARAISRRFRCSPEPHQSLTMKLCAW